MFELVDAAQPGEIDAMGAASWARWAFMTPLSARRDALSSPALDGAQRRSVLRQAGAVATGALAQGAAPITPLAGALAIGKVKGVAVAAG